MNSSCICGICRRKTQSLNASNPADIALAADLLRAGELVAMPTETVYGLAANALDEAAVARIFAAKGRPQDNPLIAHVYDEEQARKLVKAWPFTATLLAGAFWPGPLTFILQRDERVPGIVSAGLSTLALRVPAHPAAQALLRAAGIPLAAPSANRSGSPSPTLASHALYDLNGKIAAVLDGGPCTVGVESTVLDLTSKTPCLLRPGGVPVEQLEAALGQAVEISPAVAQSLEGDAPAPSPGMKYRHYAPRAALTLVHGTLRAFLAHAMRKMPDGLLVFDADAIPGAWPILRFGDTPEQQAQQLFARLREIDERGWRTAFVRCPEKDGLGLAVYNRLLRAANFREVS
ncbi:MAG: threonylcarbamoyl-AMP synthase [Oscillospiraceae bacterium]|jgi:L-threonylcarbamoyladenylate synthase|nr:threonylcarbamoyl-AMP synthase [Oscillospiraceae bacterium]